MKKFLSSFLSCLSIGINICFFLFFPKMHGNFPFKFQDLLAIQSSFVQIHLVIFSLIIAVFGFLGYRTLQEILEKKAQAIASKVAKETAKEEAKKEVEKKVDQVLKLAEKPSSVNPALGSPLHSALDSRKSEEIEEVYSDE